jgi:hypothetical protein
MANLKDCEQKVLSKLGQLAASEIPGAAGDISGHFRGWVNWRRSKFELTRFEKLETDEQDDSIALERDYIPQPSARRSSKKIKLT